jgi:ABC-type polysaccharide/polyol phosphate export permease
MLFVLFLFLVFFLLFFFFFAEQARCVISNYNRFRVSHAVELTMDAVFSLSGIILRCYLLDETSGKWNWKVETNPVLPIILESYGMLAD